MNNTQWLIHTHLGSGGFFPPFQFAQPLITFRLDKMERPLTINTKKSHTEHLEVDTHPQMCKQDNMPHPCSKKVCFLGGAC